MGTTLWAGWNSETKAWEWRAGAAGKTGSGMTAEELRQIEQGCVRWHAVSSTTVQRLIDYIRELELENMALKYAVKDKGPLS